jgi:hypothetical protein
VVFREKGWYESVKQSSKPACTQYIASIHSVLNSITNETRSSMQAYNETPKKDEDVDLVQFDMADRECYKNWLSSKAKGTAA